MKAFIWIPESLSHLDNQKKKKKLKLVWEGRGIGNSADTTSRGNCSFTHLSNLYCFIKELVGLQFL